MTALPRWIGLSFLLGVRLPAGPAEAAAADVDWPEYLGGPERSHFSPLRQINADNVGRLRIAWQYHTGDYGEMQCNPLIVQGVLYGTTASGQVFAVDAATGKERWRHRAQSGEWTKTVRGLAYWSDGAEERIYFTVASLLYAVDARTGAPVAGFGANGAVSLKAGLGPGAENKWVVSSTPGTVFGDLLIMPTRVNEEAGAAPGFIQAFNTRTGRLVWVFRTIPRPGELGHDTWPADAHKDERIGGANSWAGMSIDRERGLLFVPTGSASPDFWGGYRTGQNLFANCLLALDARTGERRWHFQFVHHDLWDRDLPAPPNLLEVKRGGVRVLAVAQVTKSGHVFVFHRLTGEPLFPIDEVPVPPSGLPGEEAWPTQPVPRSPAPFARQTISERDLNPFSPDGPRLLEQFREARKGVFQPFGKDTTLLFPGFDGGAEWGGAAVDLEGVLYVNATEMAWLARLVDAPTESQLSRLGPGQRLYTVNCVGCHGAELQGNPASGFPSLRDVASRRSAAEIDETITRGKGMMPGFGVFTQSEKKALFRYLAGQETPDDHAGREFKSAAAPAAESANAPRPGTPFRLDGYHKFVDSQGYPAIAPPWGTLSAIDLNTGDYRWQVPLGEFRELTERGIPPTGAENYGGPVLTGGGVLFIAATKDGMFRAFEMRTGRLLWQTALPAAGFATPSTYQVGGRQYVVIACGGTKLGTPRGDSYVAFALPEDQLETAPPQPK